MGQMRLRDFPFESGAFGSDQIIDVSQIDVSEATPQVAFIVPVYNQEVRIGRCLESIQACATLPHEIVVLVDGCTDRSQQVIEEWVERVREKRGLTSRITITRTLRGLFETLSDSIGVALSSAPYVIEVQADMYIEHVGFDELMVSSLRAVPDLVMLSGRGGHNLTAPFPVAPRGFVESMLRTFTHRAINLTTRLFGVYRPSLFEYWFSSGIGRVGNRIEARTVGGDRVYVYVAQAVMRGPLAIRRDVWEELGGFDTSRFFLGDDDHDFAFRLAHRGWRAGYVPVRFSSPLEGGSTRAKKSPEQQAEFQALRDHYAARQGDIELRPPAVRVAKRRYRVR